MNIGKACAIFEQIDSDKYTDAEKLEAVREVVAMPTHNGITKSMMLDVLRWFSESAEEVAKVPRWIPVTERLPEKAGEYLVVFHFNYGGIPRKNEVYVGLDSFRGKTTWAKRDNRTVTHWMPLPEPPEVE